MVRMGNNPSGSRPNFFGRQHLTFDKGGKDIVLFEGKCSFERVRRRGGIA